MNFIRKKGSGCRVFVAPCDVRLDCDDRTIVQPDLIPISIYNVDLIVDFREIAQEVRALRELES